MADEWIGMTRLARFRYVGVPKVISRQRATIGTPALAAW